MSSERRAIVQLCSVRSRSRALRSLALLSGALLCAQACLFPDYRTPEDTVGGPLDTVGGAAGNQTSGGVAASAPGGSVSGFGANGGSTAQAGEPDGVSGAGGVGGASSEPGPLAGRSRWVAVHSSKCLDAEGPALTGGGTSIGQHACATDRAQIFVLRDAPGGAYTFGIEGTDDCVAVVDGSSDDKASVLRAPCDGEKTQQWLPVPQSDGSYFWVNRLSGKCLDVPGRSTDDVGLQQFTCNVGGNQRYQLVSLEPHPLPLVLDDLFIPQPWDPPAAASMMTQSNNIDQACDGDRAPKGRGDCHVISIATFPADATLSGATWLYPQHNYGVIPGFVLAAGARRIQFQARGKNGGEKVTFKAGGQVNVFSDTFELDAVELQLTSDWQTYKLELGDMPYGAGIIAAFAWRAELAHNAAPLQFYVDDIVWQ